MIKEGTLGWYVFYERLCFGRMFKLNRKVYTCVQYVKDIIPQDCCDGILIVAREIGKPTATYRVIKASDYMDTKITVFKN